MTWLSHYWWLFVLVGGLVLAWWATAPAVSRQRDLARLDHGVATSEQQERSDEKGTTP